MAKIVDFIKANKITSTAYRVDDNPNMDDSANMDHWKVTLKADGKRMTIPFSMGYAHKGKEPKASEVLDCLASDASGIDNARDFEDFCSEYGYDTDSRKAEKTYKACQRSSAKLRKFLGDDAFETLLWNTERM